MENEFEENGNKIKSLMIIFIIVGIGVAVAGFLAFFCSNEGCVSPPAGIIECPVEDDRCTNPIENVTAVEKISTEVGIEKLEKLKAMVSDPIIQNAIKNSNLQDGKMSEDIRNQIYSLREKEWIQAQENTPFMKSIINNEVSEFLKNHHTINSQKFGSVTFGEHILTNYYGANVAVSVKTDNYDQSQDDWWQIAFQDDELQNFARECEFDSSAGIFSEDIVLKINDENGEFIGILNSATPCDVTQESQIKTDKIIPISLENITPIGHYKIDHLKNLTAKPIIQNSLEESNRKFMTMSLEEIKKLQEETEWSKPNQGEPTSVQLSLMGNNIAKILQSNTELESEEFGIIQFPEIILTNARGVTVASTGITFNYIHNEDEWWKVALENDVLVRHCGLDKSIDMNSEDIIIKIYNKNDEFIGILNSATPCNVVLKKPISFYGDSN